MKKHSDNPLVTRPAISSLSIALCLVILLSGLPSMGDVSTARKAPAVDSHQTSARSSAQVGTVFGRLPLQFELNLGQADPEVRFTARSRDGIARLTSREAVLEVFRPAAESASKRGRKRLDSGRDLTASASAKVRLRWAGANPNARITGVDELPGKTHYYTGNDPKKWHRNVPNYRKVKYEEIYPGIDLIHYGTEEGRLEYDYVVAPGADPKRIAISIEGAKSVKIDEAGDLVLGTVAGEIRQTAPRIYQEENGARRVVEGGYVLSGEQEVSFALGSYEQSKPLVIDPELVYATYLGGNGLEEASDIAVGPDGSAYITYNAVVPQANGDNRFDFAVRKLSPDGSAIVFTAVLSSAGAFVPRVLGKAIAVDATGAAYVAGSAGSSFPTKNAIQATPRDSVDAFVAKLAPDGSDLVYSTFLGGSLASGINSIGEEATDIVVDADGVAYVAGNTNASANNFPLKNSTQATYGGGDKDGFVSIISASGSSLLFSTYVGRVGNDQVGREGDDEINSIAVNPQNSDVYLGGVTFFPSNSDADELPFISHFKRKPNGATFQWTALNDEESRRYEYILFLLAGVIGEDERVSGILFTKGIEVYLFITAFERRIGPSSQSSNSAGGDNSSANGGEIAAILGEACIATTPSTTCTPYALLITIDLDVKLKTATNLGDSMTSGLRINGITGNSQGAIYLTGSTRTITTVNPTQPTSGGLDDAFIMALATNSRQVAFATYLGGGGRDAANGIAVDQQGNIYVAGDTDSTNFPVTPGALQTTHGGQHPNFGSHIDAFIAKIGGVTIPTGPDFSLGFSQSTITANRGSKVNLVVNINRAGGFGGNVTVTPPQISVKGLKLPSAARSTTGGNVKFKLKIKGSAPVGPQQLIFTGRDDSGRERTATVTVMIQ